MTLVVRETVYADHRGTASSSHTENPALVETTESGYNLATMRHEIILSPEALEDLDELKASVRAEVLDAIECHLRHQPQKVSKSRIKRLRGLSRPQFRLRVGDDVRVFYDVLADVVSVLAIIPKSRAATWLERYGESDEEGPAQ